MRTVYLSTSEHVEFDCDLDLSRDVTIALLDDKKQKVQQINIPKDAMREFVAEVIRNAKHAKLKAMTTDELLQP